MIVGIVGGSSKVSPEARDGDNSENPKGKAIKVDLHLSIAENTLTDNTKLSNSLDKDGKTIANNTSHSHDSREV